MCWSAAAEVKRVNFTRRLLRPQLQLNGPQVIANEVFAPSDKREVTVAAAMAAERDMDVGRARRRVNRGPSSIVELFDRSCTHEFDSTNGPHPLL